MKTWICLYTLLCSCSVIAQDNIEAAIEITAELTFNMLDEAGKRYSSSTIDFAYEISSASFCNLYISADDDYFNSYLGELNILMTQQRNILPYFQIKSLYLDENSQYWLTNIKQVSYTIGPLTIDQNTWHQKTVKGTYLLFSPSLEQGQLAFHQISMGRPLTIELFREKPPMEVTITVAPITAKVANLIRRCMALLDENADNIGQTSMINKNDKQQTR